MGRRKGDNPFKKGQKAKILAKVKIINGYLSTIPKGVSFEDLNALIRYVVDKVGCARSTIVRQTAYMNIIVAKYSELNKNIEDVDINSATTTELKQLIEYYQASIGTIKGDFARKEKYYQSAEYLNEIEQTKLENMNILTFKNDSSGQELEINYQYKFEATCEVLKALINKLESLGIQYDPKSKMIIDKGLDGIVEVILPDKSMPSAKLGPFDEYFNVKPNL